MRFYRWDGQLPWRHQRNIPQHWQALADGELSMVRRPSGGDAVLHDGGLTYALIWPDAPRQRHQAYQQACQWLIDGFASLGCRLDFGQQPTVVGADNCFARSTAADLVDDREEKHRRAQRWSRVDCFSMVKSCSTHLPRSGQRCSAATLRARRPRIPRDNLEDHLIAAFSASGIRQLAPERLQTP